jgi:HEAT repeat protein
LPEPIQVWVLREMIHQGVEDQGRRIRDIVRSATGEVLLCALRCLQKCAAAEGDEDLLQPLYRHENPAVRAAALQGGITRLNWKTVLEREENEEVRLAVIDRIKKSADTDAIPHLARLVEDQSWRIRARATNALAAFAPQSLPVLRDLLGHESENVRASAIQALRVLEQEEDLVEAL